MVNTEKRDQGMDKISNGIIAVVDAHGIDAEVIDAGYTAADMQARLDEVGSAACDINDSITSSLSECANESMRQDIVAAMSIQLIDEQLTGQWLTKVRDTVLDICKKRGVQ
jgi:hypothetical protein